MTSSSYSKATGPLSVRRRVQPSVEPKRCSIDAVQTNIAANVQSLDKVRFKEQLRDSIAELPDATGLDAAFLVLFTPDRKAIECVISTNNVFSAINAEALEGESLTNWPWLTKQLSNLKVIEVNDTAAAPAEASDELNRFAALGIGAALAIGFVVRGEMAGFFVLANGHPVKKHHADIHVLMKLMGSSLASGIERMRIGELLDEYLERDKLVSLTANDGIWDFDGQSKCTRVSPRWKGMLGYDIDQEDFSPDWYQLLHPDDMEHVQKKMQDHLEGNTEFFESIHRMKHQNGDWRWVTSRAKALQDERGRLVRLLGVEVDITEQKLYEEALFREKERAQITLSSIGDGVITTDSECNVEYINPVAEELTGWSVDDAAGKPIDEIFRGFHEETCEPLENPLSISIRRNRPTKSVRPTLLIRRDGNELYIESTASPIRNGEGNANGGVLVFHDVSESRELNRRLSYHASHDILTGLVNRAEFENRLERALRSAKAKETSYALCYLDLDQFKIVNDSCGHQAGDALLGQLGALLKSKIRWRDTIARLGGDEFGVLLESCNSDQAIAAAEQLRLAVSDFKFLWEDRSFRVGASIGVVPITSGNEDVAGLLSAADSACTAAKEAGGSRIHTFKENDIEIQRRRREQQWAARINNALEEHRFELFRQKIQPLILQKKII